MLVRPCAVLDGSMSVSDVITRLARQGYWLDSTHPRVRAVVLESAEILKLPVEAVAKQLARPFSLVGAAIRRQWYASILWYACPLPKVLQACHHAASDDQPLFLALGLREDDSMPLIPARPDGQVSRTEGIVVAHGAAVAVSLENWGASPPVATVDSMSDTDDGDDSGQLFSLPVTRSGGGLVSSSGSSAARETAARRATEVRSWPRIDAPNCVSARKPFDVVVGLAMSRQAGVLGGEVVFQPPAGTKHIDVDVVLVGDSLDAPDGWSRTMTIDVNNPTAAEVTFKLVGRDPAGTEPVQLVLLEVRYSYGGSGCGTASRPLVIFPAGVTDFNLPAGHGTPWLDQPLTASSFSVKPDPDAADLTIEIVKPDGNSAQGNYTCRLTSPHALASSMGPFQIELGNDAQSFAKMIVNQIRAYAGHAIVDNMLESHGKRIARALGSGVLTALREVADRVKPAVPAVLLVSAEPYVPWELAYFDPPLDPQRPSYLGAQVVVGRWLRSRGGVSDKPPVQPPSQIKVKHMAVMAGMYKAESGLNRLPEAEAEAKLLQQTYNAVPLAASLQAVKQLLDARLEHNFETIGGVEAIHFAGHGDYDPSVPDAATLYLSDGTPLFASLFGSARYGAAQSPFFFLNACMAGIGDELLGDAGGFPGNCLDGGFGAMLGALWEVDDKIARHLAIEFWARALPTGGGMAEPLGTILRDLRAKYIPDQVKVPATTYLAYVYYGHPRLTLQKSV